MATPPLPDEVLRQTLKAVAAAGTHKQAAPLLKVSRRTVSDRVREAERRGISLDHQQNLEAYGYSLDHAELTDKEAWESHARAFELAVSGQLRRNECTMHRNGAYVIYHSTDQHIDDDKSALKVLEADIAASHAMGAIMCHGGDLLNNWPMAGRLAKQWAEQSCTLPNALKRAKYFIEIFKPDVWVDGNHEEFNPYLSNLFAEWLPNVFRDYWRCDFTVKVKGGRDCQIALSHKFQKGNSWFHGTHGHIREMLQSDPRDIYMDGHFHQSAVMYHTLPERDYSALLVASAGYKILDKWAARISRGGKVPRIDGRAHWLVIDPFTESGQMATAFKTPEHAEIMLNGLQNLREL